MRGEQDKQTITWSSEADEYVSKLLHLRTGHKIKDMQETHFRKCYI